MIVFDTLYDMQRLRRRLKVAESPELQKATRNLLLDAGFCEHVIDRHSIYGQRQLVQMVGYGAPGVKCGEHEIEGLW